MRSLEAVYGGFRFRSRLECRWWIFWEALEEPAAYEPEAIDLGPFAYQPDYWLSLFRAWVEIKGEMVTEEAGNLMIEKCHQLAIQSGRPTILNFDDPYDAKCAIFIKDRIYTNARWSVCPMCGRLAVVIRSKDEQYSIAWCPEAKRHGVEALSPAQYSLARRRVYDAAVKARSHRFGVSRKAS